MRKDWRKIALKDICTVFVDGDWVESKDQSTEGIRLIQTGNIGFGYFKDKKDKSRFISEDTFTRLKCTEVLPGDLLVSRLPDPVGKSCIVPDIKSKMITGVDCTIIRTKDDLMPKFLLYYQMSNQYLSDVARRITGTTRSRISRKNLGLIEIPVPPLLEQKRIVAIFDKAFTAIEKAENNTEQSLEKVKELFETYLHNAFENKGVGWKKDRIKDICKLKSGTTISKTLERNEGDVLYTKVADMNLPENQVDMNTSSRFVNSKEIKSKQIIPEGAIIFPKRGGAIATNKKRKVVKPTIVDLNTMAIIPSNEIDNDYFYYWFQLFDLSDISNGANIPQINNYSFDDINISYPESLNKQKQIVKKIISVSMETNKIVLAYRKKKNALNELKKSILQKAFSGELTN